MARLNELEDENWRLKKMYAEEQPKAEIVPEVIQKGDGAILPIRDGTTGCIELRQHPAGLLVVQFSLDLLPLSGKAMSKSLSARSV
jgi:hypothetical protein